jgi:hypothetical protein
MSTSVRVSTRTHSYTHVATNMLRSLKQIIVGCGLSQDVIVGEWDALERGATTWLSSQHLRKLVLEVFDRRSDALIGRFDFTITYDYYGSGDGDLWLDPTTVDQAIRRAGLYPSNCNYRIVADTAPGRPDVEGWSTTSLRSTAGFSQQSLGTGIGGGSVGASLSYYRRNS